MTTVVYRDGILASDSKVTSDGHIYEGNVKKIFKTTLAEQLSFMDRIIFRKVPRERDYLVGFCGALADAQDYFESIFHGSPQVKESYDCNIIAIHINDEGEEIIEAYDGTSINPMTISTPYIACGSGGHIALGALYQGASAIEAVTAAIHHDNMSGGDVQTLSFEEDND